MDKMHYVISSILDTLMKRSSYLEKILFVLSLSSLYSGNYVFCR